MPGCEKHSKDMHALYIDDLSEAEAVNLKKQLVNRYDRTKHILPAGSILQNNLNRIESFTSINLMKINEKKSKVMMFNKSKNMTFPQSLLFQMVNF